MLKLNAIDLNKLHVFFVVVESGGVGAAASALGRTSSAVSQSLSSLESTLGAKLFDRTGRRMVLTRAGQLLHARYRDVQGSLAAAVEEVGSAGGEIRGLIRIGLFAGFPRALLADFGAGFLSRHPRVSLRIVHAPQEDLDERLQRNRLDFVLSFRPRSEVSSRIASERLFTQELVLVAAKKLAGRSFDIERLRATPAIDYYQTDPLIERWVAHHFGRGAVEVAVRCWAATTDLVLDLVLRGCGVAVLPRHVVASHVRAGALSILFARRAPLVDHIWLNEPTGAFRDATLEAFRTAVLAELGSPAPARRSAPAQEL